MMQAPPSPAFLPCTPLPRLPRVRRSAPTQRRDRVAMLSRAASKFLRHVQAGLVASVKPTSLGVSARLPRSAALFHDPDSRVAVALCNRRSRFATKQAQAVLAVLIPLVEARTVDSFVVALNGPGAVCSKARRAVEEVGGELVKQTALDGAVAEDTEPLGADDVVPVQTLNTENLQSVRDEAGATTLGEDVQRSASKSRLGLLSKERRKQARKRMRRRFELCADHQPTGDQPKAIEFLTDGLLQRGKVFQTLHGVTGSGKTFMMANVIANVNCPTLILAPNKTLAAQLCNELSRYFPKNRVEFFVSHFKFYQPEAYMPNSDKYIAKASAVDPDIDRLRHAATMSLFERNDTIVVASVSSIYGLGLPTEYLEGSIRIHVGDELAEGMNELAENLISLNYVEGANKEPVSRGFFRLDSDFIEVGPPWEPEGTVYRIIFQKNAVLRLERYETKGDIRLKLGQELVLYPARHFVTPKDRREAAILQIEDETKLCAEAFRTQGKLLEAARLEERVFTDMEMMRKVGYCSGAENYSLYLSARINKGGIPGPPETLLDYMPRDGKWLLFIDESHVTVPQLGAMYAGNAARKRQLIRHGFRLPSAMENRPLNSREFWQKTHQTIFVSATPGSFEIEQSGPDGIVEAVIRPTGVVDPTVDVVGTKGQIEHLTVALAKVAAANGRAIVTTLTKRFAEDLADCISRKPAIGGVLERSLRVSFLHSGIDSVGRMQVLEAMRSDPQEPGGKSSPQLDVVVGVNLLREGIDLPNVRLVAILDADSEGFLRGETALIQTIGRAARNVEGHVIMYADTMTSAMHRAIAETSRRRRLQVAYNALYRITPTAVGFRDYQKARNQEITLLGRIRKLKLEAGESLQEQNFGYASERSVAETRDLFRFLDGYEDLSDASSIRSRMLLAANAEDFETAALLRDRLVRMETIGR